jgi:hypothetical protein
VNDSNQPLIVYVDVDDTLVRSVGSKRVPLPRVIEHVRRLHEAGAQLYCWSSGGAEYAMRSANELGIGDCFVSFLPKPNVLIDDQSVADWRLCLEVHPLSIGEKTPDEYWKEIRSR